MVKFQKFYVTNGTQKARVFYSLDNRTGGRKCVTLYAKDHGALGEILSDAYRNDTDTATDHFDKGRAIFFEEHPDYPAARARAERNERENEAHRKAKVAAAIAAASDAALDDFNYVGSRHHY